MKKLFAILAACILALSSVLTAYAADGKVTYSGNAGQFVFEPGTDHSLTDLFPNFKGVMPGDTLTQKITVKNDADHQVKVKIYMRSLGAHQGSEEFLSQMGLRVTKSEENTMEYMFLAAAHETAQLTDWVCLGTLYSGGEVNLDVTLFVPAEMGNEFQSRIGYLDWEFMVEEFPVEDDDPKPPDKTGDTSHMEWIFAIMILALCMLIILFAWRKKEKQNKENAV